MRMGKSNKPGISNARLLEARMLIIYDDIEAFHFQTKASTYTYDHPVPERWECSYKDRRPQLMMTIGLWQGYPYHITSLHGL